MTFQRRPTNEWPDEVPGARWFKADLHVHAVDDHHGSRGKMPAGLPGSQAGPDAQVQYVRHFLHAIARNGAQVVALAPHGDGEGKVFRPRRKKYGF